jgi:hypothetical protein
MTLYSPRFKADLEKTMSQLSPNVGAMLYTTVGAVIATMDRIGGVGASRNMDV